MKQSMRAKRMKRNHKRLSNVTKLNLVSLMDIFTILVFFLMVNTSEVQVMQNNKAIELPKSVSTESAQDNLVVTVTSKEVLLQGLAIISIEALIALDTDTIKALTAEFEYQLTKRPPLSEDEKNNGLGINIMADKSVPYALLKKVMQTSAAAGYSNISLAVAQIPVATDSTQVEDVNTAPLEVTKSD